MSRLLVVGANGQVGRELRRSLYPLGEVIATTRDGRLEGVEPGGAGVVCVAADLVDPEGLAALVRELRPTAVLNAAAYTAVDKAESDEVAAFLINAEAPGTLARTCAEAGIPLVHYSTDYVFDGAGTRPYREDDPTHPLGVYGASKLAGEEAIRASGCRHLIFRTAWVYASHGKNFLRTMLRLGAEREELKVVSDQIGTPTPAALIADVTAQALHRINEHSGTWHLTASGQTSWHGFADAIFEGALARGLIEGRPNVLPIPTTDYPTPAKRPAYSCLDVSRLQSDFSVVLPDWRQGLGRVLDEVVSNTTA